MDYISGRQKTQWLKCIGVIGFCEWDEPQIAELSSVNTAAKTACDNLTTYKAFFRKKWLMKT